MVAARNAVFRNPHANTCRKHGARGPGSVATSCHTRCGGSNLMYCSGFMVSGRPGTVPAWTLVTDASAETAGRRLRAGPGHFTQWSPYSRSYHPNRRYAFLGTSIRLTTLAAQDGRNTIRNPEGLANP